MLVRGRERGSQRLGAQQLHCIADTSATTVPQRAGRAWVGWGRGSGRCTVGPVSGGKHSCNERTMFELRCLHTQLLPVLLHKRLRVIQCFGCSPVHFACTSWCLPQCKVNPQQVIGGSICS